MRQREKAKITEISRPARILVVEDEPNMVAGLRDNFEFEGYEVITARDGIEGLRRALEESPDLVVLDVMMPRMSGLEVCKQLRAQRGSIPIIMLTARGQELDKVVGLELGADDYVTKPFSIRELLARVKAVLRRADPHKAPATGPEAKKEALVRGKLALDPQRHECTWDGKPVRLTVTEFLILQSLAQRPGFVKSRDSLMDAAYDDQVYVDDRTIDSHIKRLRKKFKQVDDNFDAIETLYGVGYRYREA